MDHILTKLFENPVICVKGNNASNLLHKITEIVSNVDSSSTFAYICDEYKKNILKYFLPSKIKLYSYEESIENLISNKNFASIIYLDNLEEYTLNNFLIMNLWSRNYNSHSKVHNRLVLFCNGQEIINTPFILENKYIINDSKVSIEYYTTDFSGKDKYKLNENIEYIVRKKHEENPLKFGKNSTYVVYMDSHQECSKLYYIMKNLENAFVYMITNKTEPHILKKFSNNKSTKRKIIITNFTELQLKNVDGVFDSLYTCVTNENFSKNKEKQILPSVKIICDKKSHFNNSGFCVRMCKENYYDKLHQSNISEVAKFNWYKIFLLCYENNINPDEIFNRESNLEKFGHTNSFLCDLDLIYIDDKRYKLTNKGVFCSKFKHLEVKNSLFLKLWMDKKLPIFPGIVTACILENYSYYYGNKKNNKFLHLLELVNKYFEKSKTLDLSNIKDFCKIYKIYKQNFETLLENIINVVMYLKNYYYIELGLYKHDNVYNKSKQFLRKIYYQDMISVEDKIEKIYKDKQGIQNSFDTQVMENDFSFPKKIICMKRKKVFQKNMYIMLEYIIL